MRQRLQIYKIKDNGGQWLRSIEDISFEGASSYPRHLNGDHDSSSDEFIQNIPTIVTVDQNASLTTFSSLDEVYHVMQDTDENNTAGPDGYNGFFYTVCWEIIKIDFHTTICELFAGFDLPRCWRSTLIVPIPKN